MQCYKGLECSQYDAKARQPTRIKTALKPHQLTSIAKMTAMEEGGIEYDAHNYYGPSSVETSTLGILADKAGYGKTLTTPGVDRPQPKSGRCGNDDGHVPDVAPPSARRCESRRTATTWTTLVTYSWRAL
jgi:hypothetical protein